jgi:hypothetical protein
MHACPVAALRGQEIADVVERFLERRPWVRPLTTIADPPGIVAFVGDQLGDVMLRDDGWTAVPQPGGILVTRTPRLGPLPRSELISWSDIAGYLRPDLSAAALGGAAPGDDSQPRLF